METPQGCSGLLRRASQVAGSAELTAQLQRRRDEQAAASSRRKLQDTVQRCAMLKPLAEVRDRTVFGQKPQQSYCVRYCGWCTPRDPQRSRKCSQTSRQTHIFFCAHVNLYFCVVRFLVNARFWNIFVCQRQIFYNRLRIGGSPWLANSGQENNGSSKAKHLISARSLYMLASLGADISLTRRRRVRVYRIFSHLFFCTQSLVGSESESSRKNLLSQGMWDHSE